MLLTPLDAEKERFRVSFRGYARDEVERFRAQAIQSLEEHIALESQLKTRTAELESQIKRYRETEDLVKDSVVLAQRTCDELIAAAHQKADVIKQEAHLAGALIRTELADLRSQREQFEYAFHGLLAGFTHRLEQGNPALGAPPEVRVGELGPATAPVPVQPPDIAPAEPASIMVQLEPQEVLRSVPPADAELSREADAAAPVIPPVPAIPEVSVPGVPTAASQPGPSAAPARQAPGPAVGPEVDRDADIADFTAALDHASDSSEPGWPEKDQKTGLFGIPDNSSVQSKPEDLEG